MDFMKLRKLNRDVILGAYGVPYSILGGSEQINKANAEAGAYVFARWVIKPRLTRFREKMNEQFCPMFGEGLELEFEDPVPEDREALIVEAERGVKAGFLTVNEARQLLGYDELKSGNVFLLPINLLPQPAKQMKILPVRKALFDNEEMKEVYWKKWVSGTEDNEKPIISALKDLFAKQESEALGNLKEGIKPTESLINQSKAKKDYTEAVMPIMEKTLKQAIRDGADLVSPENPHAGKQEHPMQPEALRWLKTRIGWAAAEVGEETASLLANQLALGFEAGESMADIAVRVKSTFGFCSDVRALRIARTEIIMASNEGALWGYESSEVVEKAEFYAALDERVCEDCMDLHGQTFKLDDAHGIIPVHPNCRCCWLPVI
jgi:SPP1 gp7 family putative phage head morphogenesis protein